MALIHGGGGGSAAAGPVVRTGYPVQDTVHAAAEPAHLVGQNAADHAGHVARVALLARPSGVEPVLEQHLAAGFIAQSEVNRKARRAKTDRLDVRKLLALLMRWTAGERKAWSVVHVPSLMVENDRQLTRELDAVRNDRTRVRNRIHGLLATQGVRLAIDRHFETALAAVQTGDGRPFPPALCERLRREWTHLQIIEARLGTLETLRDERIAHGTDRVAHVARRLLTLRGVGDASAAVFSAELFGTRTFQNPRQVGAVTGLVPERLLQHFPQLERFSHKYIFGTDWPAMPKSVAHNLQAVRNLGLSDAALQRILHDNAAQLLKL